MKFGLIGLMVPLVMVAGTAALAQSAPSETAPSQPVVKEKKICRADDSIGSIVPRRTCHTKTEWAALDAQSENSRELDGVRRGQHP